MSRHGVIEGVTLALEEELACPVCGSRSVVWFDRKVAKELQSLGAVNLNARCVQCSSALYGMTVLNLGDVLRDHSKISNLAQDIVGNMRCVPALEELAENGY